MENNNENLATNSEILKIIQQLLQFQPAIQQIAESDEIKNANPAIANFLQLLAKADPDQVITTAQTFESQLNDQSAIKGNKSWGNAIANPAQAILNTASATDVTVGAAAAGLQITSAQAQLITMGSRIGIEALRKALDTLEKTAKKQRDDGETPLDKMSTEMYGVQQKIKKAPKILKLFPAYWIIRMNARVIRDVINSLGGNTDKNKHKNKKKENNKQPDSETISTRSSSFSDEDSYLQPISVVNSANNTTLSTSHSNTNTQDQHYYESIYDSHTQAPPAVPLRPWEALPQNNQTSLQDRDYVNKNGQIIYGRTTQNGEQRQENHYQNILQIANGRVPPPIPDRVNANGNIIYGNAPQKNSVNPRDRDNIYQNLVSQPSLLQSNNNYQRNLNNGSSGSQTKY